MVIGQGVAGPLGCEGHCAEEAVGAEVEQGKDELRDVGDDGIFDEACWPVAALDEVVGCYAGGFAELRAPDLAAVVVLGVDEEADAEAQSDCPAVSIIRG
jgi:hypothetical protein